MENRTVSQNNEEIVYMTLESQIRNNNFKSKEELTNRLIQLKNYGRFGTGDDANRKIQQLLDLYDSLNKTNENPLNTENYQSVSLQENNFIVSTETDQILRTQNNRSDMEEEFKHTQNEITANNQNGLANADTVFNHMAENKKEEVKLMPLSEVPSRDDINVEILQKIKFFISNKYINAYEYKIDIENGIFYNIETSEVYEVRKNLDTNQYEIYRGNELVYENNNQYEESEPKEKEEEQKEYESRNNVKVRKLVPNYYNDHRAAFSQIGFLAMNIITFTALITMIILLNK